MVNMSMLLDFLGLANKTLLIILMIVLIAFIVLMVVLGVVFIVALRKRAPVVKVVMAPLAQAAINEPEEEEEEETVEEPAPDIVHEDGTVEKAPEKPHHVPEPEPEEDTPEDTEEVDVIMEGQERVRYDRSMEAKICQLKGETKEWYNELKNEILSYERAKSRMSWRRESFRVGRMTFARLTIRGKTLCFMLAVEPAGYTGTKYSVEDVSNVAATADTPTLYRIKSARRLKYAKEMMAGLMKELKIYKNSHYEPKNYKLPHESDAALMEKGLIKRVVTGTDITYRIEVSEAAATTAESSAESKPTEKSDK